MKAVEYQIKLSDKFSEKMDRVSESMDRFHSEMDGTNDKLKKTQGNTGALMGKFKGLLKVGIFAGIGYKVGQLGKNIVKLGADMEQTEIAFTTMLGSAGRAKQLVADLNEFSNVTPFQNAEVIAASKTMLAMGTSAEDMTDTLKMVGDVASGINAPLGDMAMIFGQIQTVGKLTGERLMQLRERGFDPLKVMAKQTGKSVQQLQTEMSKGAISSEMVAGAFKSATSEGGQFNNMMQKQSQSLTGKYSTLMGKLQTVGIKIGKALLPVIKRITQGFINFVDSASENFHYIQDALRPVISALSELWKEVGKLFSSLFKSNSESEKKGEIWQSIGKLLKNVVLPPLKLMINTFSFSIKIIRQVVNWVKRMYDRFETFRKIVNAILYPLKKLMEGFKWVSDQVSSGEVRTISELQTLKNNYNALLKKKKQGLELSEFEIKLMENLNRKIKELTKQKKKNATEAGVTMPGGAENAGVSSQSTTTTQKVTGAAPKVFNLRIGKIVENFTVHNTTVQESAEQIRDIVLEKIEEALMDVQTNVQ